MLQDTPTVQAVLQWLRGRLPEQKWLVVVDSADDLSWNVSCIIPSGHAGSVIITSQDNQASRLLGGKSDSMRVEVMTANEADALLRKTISAIGKVDESPDFALLLQQIVNDLDRLPLTLDLAGARINAEVVDGEDVEHAMRRYVTDFQRNRTRLLQDNGHTHSIQPGKTVYTVWETSLSFVQRIDESQPSSSSLHLLGLMTLLEPANIQEELFRMASLGMEDVCQCMHNRIPLGLRKVLALGANGEWDDFEYRQAVGPLRRYGLVRSIKAPGQGLTMYNLVQWRASLQADEEEVWAWYTSFVTAVASQVLNESDQMASRSHLSNQSPTRARSLTGERECLEKTQCQSPHEEVISAIDQTHLATMWTMVGKVAQRKGRWGVAAQLFFATYQAMMKVLCKEHRSTLKVMCNLATKYCEQGRWQEAEKLHVQMLETSSRMQEHENADTLAYMDNLASIYWRRGRSEEIEVLQSETTKTSSRVSDDRHPQTSTATGTDLAIINLRVPLDEAKRSHVESIDTSSATPGDQHVGSLTAVSDPASIHKQQGWFETAEDLEVDRIEALSRVLNTEHPSMFMSKLDLPSVYSKLGRYARRKNWRSKG